MNDFFQFGENSSSSSSYLDYDDDDDSSSFQVFQIGSDPILDNDIEVSPDSEREYEDNSTPYQEFQLQSHSSLYTESNSVDFNEILLESGIVDANNKDIYGLDLLFHNPIADDRLVMSTFIC